MIPSQWPISIVEIIVAVILLIGCLVMGYASIDQDYAIQTIWHLGLVTMANVALIIVTRWPAKFRDRLIACLLDLGTRGTLGLVILVSLLFSIRAVASKMNSGVSLFPSRYSVIEVDAAPIVGILALFLIALVGNILILFQLHNSDNQTVAKWYLWITSLVAVLMTEAFAVLLISIWVYEW